MSVLQQFTSRCGPPVPPLAATPATNSLGQQFIKQVGAPRWTALPWLTQGRGFIQQALVGSAISEVEEPYLFHYDRGMTLFSMSRPRSSRAQVRQNMPVSCSTIRWGLPNQGARQGSTLQALEQAYVLEDRSAIPAFIKRNRLLELLLVAREPLTSAFGEAAVKKLTLVEDDEGFVTLFCLILVTGRLDEARRALNLFDESWWLARCGQVRGKLNFDFDLV